MKGLTVEELRRKYKGNTRALNLDHEALIEKVLSSEEGLISKHREILDSVENDTSEQRQLLDEVEQPGSDVKLYLAESFRCLNDEIDSLVKLRD